MKPSKFSLSIAAMSTLLFASTAMSQTQPDCYAKSELGNYVADAKIVMKDKVVEASYSVQLQAMKTVENGLEKSKYASIPYLVVTRGGKAKPKAYQGYSWSFYLPGYRNFEFEVGERHDKLNVMVMAGSDMLINSELTYDLNWAGLGSDDQESSTNQKLIEWMGDPEEGKLTLGLQEIGGDNTAIYVFKKKTLQNGMIAANTLFNGVKSTFQKQGCKPIGAG